jgi:preprotein translocase subunit SecG
MAKRKTGLHRKVSSIFEGVAVPKSGAAEPDESSGPGPDFQQEGAEKQRQSDFVPKGVPVVPKRPGAGGAKGIRSGGGLGAGGWGEFGLAGSVQAIGEKRRKRTMVLMVVLFVILLLVLTSTFSRNLTRKKNIAASEQAVGGARAATAGIDAQIDWEIPPKYPETLRDPMETTWARDSETGEWVEEAVVVIENGEQRSLIEIGIALKSILWAESGRSIVIADEILYEGDSILGVTIKKINKDSVEFEKDGVGFLKVFPR